MVQELNIQKGWGATSLYTKATSTYSQN